MADAGVTSQLFDLWRKQIEEGTQAWARLVSQGGVRPPAEPAAFWGPVMEQTIQAWGRALAQTPLTPDLATQWKQFMDQSIETWSRAMGEAMNTEAFAQMLGRTLDQWLVAYAPLKKAASQSVEAGLQALDIASRSQLTALARQIVELDERLERIEDGISAIVRRLDQRSAGDGGRGVAQESA
jgi:hypothetical protein